MADDARVGVAEPGVGLPVVEEVLERGVQPLLGRVPRLLQVVVDLRLVDRGDGRVRVRVGGEQRALGLRVEAARAVEQLHAGHARHALVGEHERDRLAARGELPEQLLRLRPRRCAVDAVVGAEPGSGRRAGPRAARSARRPPPRSRGGGRGPRASVTRAARYRPAGECPWGRIGPGAQGQSGRRASMLYAQMPTAAPSAYSSPAWDEAFDPGGEIRPVARHRARRRRRARPARAARARPRGDARGRACRSTRRAGGASSSSTRCRA